MVFSLLNGQVNKSIRVSGMISPDLLFEASMDTAILTKQHIKFEDITFVFTEHDTSVANVTGTLHLLQPNMQIRNVSVSGGFDTTNMISLTGVQYDTWELHGNDSNVFLSPKEVSASIRKVLNQDSVEILLFVQVPLQNGEFEELVTTVTSSNSIGGGGYTQPQCSPESIGGSTEDR